MDLKTPLYDCHVQCGGKIVPFAGYLLPVQYGSGVIAEHMAVRTGAGLFDVSHMGEIMLSGPDALLNIQKLVTNDCAGMPDGRARYSPMCNDNGGVVDDLIVYRLSEDSYMIVVNAANRSKDAEWIKSRLSGRVIFEDISDSVSQMALQGPKSPDILKKLATDASIPKKYYTFIKNGKVGGRGCIVSKTGYTGEDGYEIYCKNNDAADLWNMILDAGKEFGLIPCGLGARDTLRLEAAMPLYGHEMNEDITPFEAGLDFAVKMGKENFTGKSALIGKGRPSRRRAGLFITGKGIAREQCGVYSGEKLIGSITSGTFCPYLNRAAAMALIDITYTEPGRSVEVDVRGRRITAVVTPLPFYKK